ncbi:hypothetical protein VTG60DRAFT_294 [Thermothelomyces hinnuleus]
MLGGYQAVKGIAPRDLQTSISAIGILVMNGADIYCCWLSLTALLFVNWGGSETSKSKSTDSFVRCTEQERYRISVAKESGNSVLAAAALAEQDLKKTQSQHVQAAWGVMGTYRRTLVVHFWRRLKPLLPEPRLILSVRRVQYLGVCNPYSFQVSKRNAARSTGLSAALGGVYSTYIGTYVPYLRHSVSEVIQQGFVARSEP